MKSSLSDFLSDFPMKPSIHTGFLVENPIKTSIFHVKCSGTAGTGAGGGTTGRGRGSAGGAGPTGRTARGGAGDAGDGGDTGRRVLEGQMGQVIWGKSTFLKKIGV